MVCDAVHVCPVCHARRMASDRQTVTDIVRDHYAKGGILVDAVLTPPHKAGESLACVLDREEAIWAELRSKSIWRELEKGLGIVGYIRRLEVTLGRNGWHPHYHVSFLCTLDRASELKGGTWRAALDDAFAIVVAGWSEAAKAAGTSICDDAQIATAIIGHVDAERAVRYNLKNMGYGAKEHSLTPMDLLRIAVQVDGAPIIRRAQRLFAEYADAMKGRHVLTYAGTAKAARAAVRAAAETPAEETVEQLGRVDGDAWRAIVATGLRPVIAGVRTRRELVAVVLRAAYACGHGRIPFGWLRLSFGETKTVRGSRRSASWRFPLAAEGDALCPVPSLITHGAPKISLESGAYGM